MGLGFKFMLTTTNTKVSGSHQNATVKALIGNSKEESYEESTQVIGLKEEDMEEARSSINVEIDMMGIGRMEDNMVRGG